MTVLRDTNTHEDHARLPSDRHRARGGVDPPRRRRARGHGCPHRAPGRVRCPPPLRGGRVPLTVPVLPSRPPSVRGRGVQPDRGGASGPALPIVVDMLLSGSLSLTTLRMLARHLTAENHLELLVAAAGKGKQEVETLLARHCPQPDVAGSIRQLAAPSVRGAEVSSLPAACEARAADKGSTPFVPAPAAPPPRALVRPLAPERYEIRFTASGGMRDRLREAQDLLGHAVPSGDIAQIFDRALTLLVADLKRQKCAATSRPRPSRGQADGSPNIPAAVKRVVWVRDGGRCAFVARSTGHRCEARRFLEFHHVVPRGVGGPPTVGNIQLRCRAHNGHEVDLFYGPGVRRTRGDRDRTMGGIRENGDGRGARPGTSPPSGPRAMKSAFPN